MKLLSVLLLAGIWLPLTSGAQTTTRNYEGVGPACPGKSGVIRWPSEGTFYIEDCATGKTIVEAVFPKSEPLEVPAIHLPAKSYLQSSMSCDVDGICIDSTMRCSNNGTVVVPEEEEPNHITWPQKCKDGWHWGCKDLSRILEHSEENPPKYWCRKVKTE